MSCTCYVPSKWEDPGTAAMCAACEEAIDKAAAEEEAWNRGARMADDLVCQCCGARGHSEVTCSQRFERPQR